MKLLRLFVKKLKELREKENCNHDRKVTPQEAIDMLNMECDALLRGEGKMVCDGLSCIYGNCIRDNKNYCFDCKEYF